MLVHFQPTTSSRVWRIRWNQRSVRNSRAPSGPAVQTKAGIVSRIVRSSCSAFSDRLLGALEIFDVDARAKPPNDVAEFVAQRLGVMQHPPVLAVRFADASLGYGRLAAGHRRTPAPQMLLQIVGVDEVRPPSTFDRIKGNAKVIEAALVEVVDVAVRTRAEYQRRRRIEHQAGIDVLLLHRLGQVLSRPIVVPSRLASPGCDIMLPIGSNVKGCSVISREGPEGEELGRRESGPGRPPRGARPMAQRGQRLPIFS